MSLTGGVLERARAATPLFEMAFLKVAKPEGADWVTAWDIVLVGAMWHYHLTNGARIDPKLIVGRVDRESGATSSLDEERVDQLLATFDRVRRVPEVRAYLRHLTKP